MRPSNNSPIEYASVSLMYSARACKKCLKIFIPMDNRRRFCGKSCSGSINAPKASPPSTRFWARVKKTDCCWLWQGSTRNGYGQIMERIGRKISRSIYAHRLSYEMFHGKIASKLHVCHTCDNKICVNPSHLWLGTTGDNLRDYSQKYKTLKITKLTTGRKLSCPCSMEDPAHLIS